MSQLPTIFAANILPILLVVGAGYTVQRVIGIDPRPLAKTIFYIFSPALVFKLIVESNIGGADMVRMVAFSASTTLAIAAISWVLARLLRLPASLSSAFVISTTFMNAGNYGLPLIDLAFGKIALAWAGIYFVTNNALCNSLGVYLASLGSQSPWQALRGLFRVPAIYSIPLALLTRALHVNIPAPLEHSLQMVASATIPLMLILLGAQIGMSGLPRQKGLLGCALVVRLVISPLLTYGLAPFANLPQIAQKSAVVEAAMPTAIYATVLATQYDTEPEFATSSVLASTLLSPLTVTPLLALLGA